VVEARIAWIAVAPVKGLALTLLDEAMLEPFGVRQNRRFYLVDEEGRLVNGKRLGKLVTVRPELDEDERSLTLHFPDGRAVGGEVEVGKRVTTIFYGRPVEGRLVAGPWSEALSAVAGQTLKLVSPEEQGAAVDRGRGAFSLLSTASLEELARQAGVEEPIDGRRFRMLFGVDGLAPHEEDSWIGRRVHIADAVVIPRGNVGRCAVTTQNPETGIRDLDTLGVLKAYRDEVPTTEPLPFGVYGDVAEPGRVRVGDPVSADGRV
jgi:hypothetical protein